MIVSMTGYGTANGSTPLGHFYIEIKSVNSRYLELNIRVPSMLSVLEVLIRQLLKNRFRRGKIDLIVKWEESPEIKPRVVINEKIIKEITLQLKRLTKELGGTYSPDISALLSIPECVSVEPLIIDEKRLWRFVNPFVNQAIDKCFQFKIREGRVLRRQINDSLRVIKQSHQHIMRLKDKVIDNYKQRLREKVAELVNQNDIRINSDRLEAEALFFADKADITEELTRIQSHLAGTKQYLAESYAGQAGKALDFISQELLREVNTIASKVRDTDVSQQVLLMKNEVEKIREQVQNIE